MRSQAAASEQPNGAQRMPAPVPLTNGSAAANGDMAGAPETDQSEEIGDRVRELPFPAKLVTAPPPLVTIIDGCELTSGKGGAADDYARCFAESLVEIQAGVNDEQDFISGKLQTFPIGEAENPVWVRKKGTKRYDR